MQNESNEKSTVSESADEKPENVSSEVSTQKKQKKSVKARGRGERDGAPKVASSIDKTVKRIGAMLKSKAQTSETDSTTSTPRKLKLKAQKVKTKSRKGGATKVRTKASGKTAKSVSASKSKGTRKPKSKAAKTKEAVVKVKGKRGRKRIIRKLPQGQSYATRKGEVVVSSWKSRTHMREKQDKKSPVLCQRRNTSKIWKRDLVSVGPGKANEKLVSCRRCAKVMRAEKSEKATKASAK